MVLDALYSEDSALFVTDESLRPGTKITMADMDRLRHCVNPNIGIRGNMHEPQVPIFREEGTISEARVLRTTFLRMFTIYIGTPADEGGDAVCRCAHRLRGNNDEEYTFTYINADGMASTAVLVMRQVSDPYWITEYEVVSFDIREPVA